MATKPSLTFSDQYDKITPGIPPRSDDLSYDDEDLGLPGPSIPKVKRGVKVLFNGVEYYVIAVTENYHEVESIPNFVKQLVTRVPVEAEAEVIPPHMVDLNADPTGNIVVYGPTFVRRVFSQVLNAFKVIPQKIWGLVKATVKAVVKPAYKILAMATKWLPLPRFHRVVDQFSFLRPRRPIADIELNVTPEMKTGDPLAVSYSLGLNSTECDLAARVSMNEVLLRAAKARKDQMTWFERFFSSTKGKFGELVEGVADAAASTWAVTGFGAGLALIFGAVGTLATGAIGTLFVGSFLFFISFEGTLFMIETIFNWSSSVLSFLSRANDSSKPSGVV